MFDLELQTLFIYVFVIVFAIFLVVAFLMALERKVRRSFRSLFTRDGVDRAEVARSWKKLERLIRSKNKHEMTQAIVGADSLLDRVLRDKGMQGKTMADRLRFASHRYPQLRDIWWAHRLRNQLVHEIDFRARPRHIKGAMRAYKRALKDIHAL